MPLNAMIFKDKEGWHLRVEGDYDRIHELISDLEEQPFRIAGWGGTYPLNLGSAWFCQRKKYPWEKKRK